MSTGHFVLFGLVRWNTEHRLTGDPSWRTIEECADVDGEELCLGWAIVEVPTEGGPIRLVRFPHSLGSRPSWDEAQEAAAQGVVDGLETFLEVE